MDIKKYSSLIELEHHKRGSEKTYNVRVELFFQDAVEEVGGPR